MHAAELVDFIRDLNDFNSPSSEEDKLAFRSDTVQAWWQAFKKDQFDVIEYDYDGKVLIVFAKDGKGIGYAQVPWVETMVKIINDGRAREGKKPPLELSQEGVEVDGIRYLYLTQMARLILTTESTRYLMMQHAEKAKTAGD